MIHNGQMLGAIPLTGFAGDAVRRLSVAQGELIVGGLNLPVIGRVAAHLVVHGKVVRDGDFLGAMALAVAAAGAWNGRLGGNNGYRLFNRRLFYFDQRRNILQVVQHLLHRVHTAEDGIYLRQALYETQCPGRHAATR